MKSTRVVIFMALFFLFVPVVQAAQVSAPSNDMKKAQTLGNAAVANYKNPEINPVEVAGLGLQLFLVDLWKVEPDNSKGNNAY